MNPIPLINSRGNFVLKAPFDSKIISDIEYTVTAIRSLEEVADSNENPLEHIYIAAGLDETIYLDDLKNKIPVVILLNDAGDYTYVPGNMFLSIPKITGFVYSGKVLSVNLGAVPAELDLTDLISDLESMVENHLGVVPNIKTVDSSANILVNDDEHKFYEARRLAAVSEFGGSLVNRLTRANITIEDLKTKIEKFRCVVIKKENE